MSRQRDDDLGMKPIFSRNDYQILVAVEERRACIVKGADRVFVSLEELAPLSPLAAKHLRMMGYDPKLYLNIGHGNQIILKEAAPAWEAELAEAEQLSRRKDTSRIPLFWQSLPGLLELREAEDTYAACQKSPSLMVEYEQRGMSPARLMELRQQYPRAAAYILAETYAFSDDEGIAARGRRAMSLLAADGEIGQALALLPATSPDARTLERQRARAGNW